jgi:hypothetical protein
MDAIINGKIFNFVEFRQTLYIVKRGGTIPQFGVCAGLAGFFISYYKTNPEATPEAFINELNNKANSQVNGVYSAMAMRQQCAPLTRALTPI